MIFSNIFGSKSTDPESSAAKLNSVPNPQPTAGNFSMTIEDIFTISGRGTVVTGRISSGTISLHDTVQITTSSGVIATEIAGIEAFRKQLNTAQVGDTVGLLLKDVNRDTLSKGNTITK